MVLICKTLSPFHPRMLCARFSLNWSSVSGEDFELVNMFSLSSYYLLDKGFNTSWPFKFTNLNLLHPRILCAKFGWNWPSGSGEDEKVRNLQTERQTPGTGILVQGSGHISHTVKMLNFFKNLKIFFSTAELTGHRSNKLSIY